MKVIVIGNSHCVALELARRAGWSRTDISIDYVFAPGRNQPAMNLSDGRFYLDTKSQRKRSTLEGGIDAGVDIRQFDLVWVSAFGPLAPSTTLFEARSHPLARARPEAWPKLESTQAVPVKRMRRLIRMNLEQSGPYRFCVDASSFGVPILVQAIPRPAREVLEKSPLVADYGADVATAIYPSFLDIADVVMRNMIADVPNATLVSQPPETLASDGWTDTKFMRTYIALPPAEPIEMLDSAHGGSNYGALVLDQLVAASVSAMEDNRGRS